LPGGEKGLSKFDKWQYRTYFFPHHSKCPISIGILNGGIGHVEWHSMA